MDLTLFSIVLYFVLHLVGGYTLPFSKNRKANRIIAWIIVVVTIALSAILTSSYTPPIRMLIIVSLQLAAMKILVTTESYSGENRLTPLQWLAFSIGWFGMRPVLFETLPSPSQPYFSVLLKGLSRIIIGILILHASEYFDHHTLLTRYFVPQLFLLVGLSFILHFGLLTLSTAGWRALGVNAPELFKSPYRSRSLKEFWGKRWNMAFSEMTAMIAYKPLKAKLGLENALIVSFLLSGLLHEVAISLPVGSGYGLPMIYFTIHAIAMLLETKSLLIQKMLRHNVYSRIWVFSFLILPLPILFHPEFVQRVLVPLRAVILMIPHMVTVNI